MAKELMPPPHAQAALSDGQLLQRFARSQDAAAFAALIQRHGPMVLGVCRRVLNHEQEAEDAFQATFLVLVRRAGTLERPELLGNWLYGVAFRTAHKARARLARRRHHERQAQPMPPAEPPDPLAWQELRGVLDQELRELPAKYRVPLVLCYLEGMTNEEAARRLGWPTGSMSYRLARGRQLLRDRLRQRRQMLPTMFLATLLKQATPEEVPADLAASTLHAALSVADIRPPVPPPTNAPPVPTSTAGPIGAVSAVALRGSWSRRLLIGLLVAGLVGVAGVALGGGYTDMARAMGLPSYGSSDGGACHGSSSGTGCHVTIPSGN
jgi:RNA polymerase sigma factor (sigma-70 family)